MAEPYTAVFFDLDGTLADTAPEIYAAAAAVLADLQRPPVAFAQAREFIGDGMPRFMKRMLTRQWWGEPDAALLAEAMLRMDGHYHQMCEKELNLYDGALKTLQRLQQAGVPMACVTNKPARFTEPLLAKNGLRGFFGAVVSGDTLPQKKPDPQPLRYAAGQLATDVRSALMVGDSAADAKAAAAAPCGFAAVGYGYHRDNTPPPSQHPINRLSEILPLLRVN